MEARRQLKIEKVRGESRSVVWVWKDDVDRFRGILRKLQLDSEERSPSKYQVCFRFEEEEIDVLKAIQEFNVRPNVENIQSGSRP